MRPICLAPIAAACASPSPIISRASPPCWPHPSHHAPQNAPLRPPLHPPLRPRRPNPRPHMRELPVRAVLPPQSKRALQSKRAPRLPESRKQPRAPKRTPSRLASHQTLAPPSTPTIFKNPLSLQHIPASISLRYQNETSKTQAYPKPRAQPSPQKPMPMPRADQRSNSDHPAIIQHMQQNRGLQRAAAQTQP